MPIEQMRRNVWLIAIFIIAIFNLPCVHVFHCDQVARFETSMHQLRGRQLGLAKPEISDEV
jgi:hypothetical protein